MEPLPNDVLQLIESSIQSIDQLEILRLLGEDPSRSWTARELAPEVQVSPEVAAEHLASLDARGLITGEKRNGESFWRHGPHTPERQAQVSRLLQLYRERPVSMIKAVYNRPADALWSFSDAFRLRKEED